MGRVPAAGYGPRFGLHDGAFMGVFVDVLTHYASLEGAGDERMALVLSCRHPDAPYKNHMLDSLAYNCSAEVIE